MSLHSGLICVMDCDGGYSHLVIKMTSVTSPEKYGVVFDISGDDLAPGLHGFHIHTTGNLTRGCASLGGHYNPTGENHGDLNDPYAHRGDLGNILVDRDGHVNVVIRSNLLKLSELVGRSLVLHEKHDDLGLGGDAESLKTGNSGQRICCGIIGFA